MISKYQPRDSERNLLKYNYINILPFLFFFFYDVTIHVWPWLPSVVLSMTFYPTQFSNTSVKISLKWISTLNICLYSGFPSARLPPFSLYYASNYIYLLRLACFIILNLIIVENALKKLIFHILPLQWLLFSIVTISKVF